LRKIVIEVEAENLLGLKIYLEEVLSTLSKNIFFSIKNFNIKVVEEDSDQHISN